MQYLKIRFYDYAAALVEAGYVPMRGFRTPPTSPASSGDIGDYLDLYDNPISLVVSFHGPPSLRFGDSRDIIAVLRSLCLAQGGQAQFEGEVDSCLLLRNVGGLVTQQEQALATDQSQLATNQAEAQRDQIKAQHDQSEEQSLQRLKTIGDAAAALSASTPTIQDTAAQQQANLLATAAAVQQRQQTQEQTRLAAEQNTRAAQATTTNARSIPGDTNANTPPATVAAVATPNTNNNPYSSTPVQGSYNPYTGAGSGPIQGSCTDMTGSVQGSVKLGTEGWVSGYLTNNSTETLYVSYTFKQNGVPSTAMVNAGGTTIQGGQTVGGEGQGLYSTGADKNPPEIYWYAVLKSEHDKYGCAHKW